MSLRVAIVHHWFVSQGGGERVAAVIASLFPEAEIFTLVAAPDGIPESLNRRTFHTSFLQKLPLATSHHRHYLPLYPAAVEKLDLREFDLVITSDSGPVKGVLLKPNAIQICYCHSPMRYLYDMYDAYRAQMGFLTRNLFSASAKFVRMWDLRAAKRVDFFLANSEYIRERIRRIYGRESTVIHPPIDLSLARISNNPGTHYLCAGRLVGYKQTALMMEACNRLGRSLRIAGTGPDEARLRQNAGRNIEFLGALSDEDLWNQYAQCRALLFAADEDFGMVPLEVQACGRPVVAYGAGGSLETVRGSGENPTGIHFPHQTVESIMDGILQFEEEDSKGMFSPMISHSWARGFSTEIFLARMREFILSQVPQAKGGMV